MTGVGSKLQTGWPGETSQHDNDFGEDRPEGTEGASHVCIRQGKLPRHRKEVVQMSWGGNMPGLLGVRIKGMQPSGQEKEE